MDPVCEQCGDVGITELLLHCTNCKNASRHRYCFPTVLFESIVEWLCSDCLRKHDEAIKSLEDVSNQRLIWGTQVGSSILSELNVTEKEVTNGLWSWGFRRNRSCPVRKDHSDANTKKFLGGDTFNHGHRVNRLLKAGSNSSDARTKQSEYGDTLNSREISYGEISENNYSEKKGEDRSDHLICPLDIDGTSHSALDHAYKTEEHNHFLDPIGKPNLNYMKCSDLLKEKDGCFSPSEYVEGSIPQARKVDIFCLVNDVELCHPTIVEKTGPTLASVEQPDGCGPILENIEKSHPFKAVEGLLYKQKSILTTKIPPNHAQPIRGSDLKTWNAESSSSSNEREGTLEKEGAERTKCVVADELVNHTLENCTGPNPSMVNDCLVYNEGNPNETNRRPAEPLLSTKHMKIQRGMSGEAYHIYDDHSARGNSSRGNETSNLKSGEGDKDGRNLKSNVGKTSSSAGKKLPHRHVLQVESINNESVSSMYVSPCESTKVNPRRPRNQSNSHTPCEAKYQKTELIKNKNVYDARSRSGRPAASLKDNQKMPWKNNGSNDENIEISKLGRHKKRDKSLLLKSSCAKRVIEVDQMEPSRQPDHTNSDAFLKVSSKTKEVPVANYVEPKKRRRLFLSYDVEDANVMQVEDLNPRSCDNNGQLKKQRRSVEKNMNNQITCVEKNKEVLRKRNLNRQSSKNHKHVKEQRCIEANEDKNGRVKKQRRYMGIGVKNQRCVEKIEKAPQPENLRRRFSKNHKQVKKQRSPEANQNQNAVVGYLDAECAKNDGSVLPSQTAVVKDHSALSKMTVMPEYICVQPIDKPYWTGIMKIGRDYIPLAAHLSSKAGKKVQELLRSLPPIMKVTEHALPKCLEAPKPIADSIVLYFFSGDARPNKELDQVVKHVADSTIVLETVVGLAKLLLFPSVVLPEEYQTYQGKHYLWAVFEQTDDKIRKLASAKQDCTAHVMEEEQVQEQHVFGQHDKPQGVTLEQEMPLVNQAVRSENQPLLDADRGIGKEALLSNGAPSAHMKARVSENISPSDHGQPCSNSGARPLELCGFVVSRTPRSVQLIQEMQKEGAIVFAVKQGLTKPVSVV